MNTQPQNQQHDIDVRMRTMRILWFAFIVSVGMYYVFTLFANRRPNPTPNNTLSLTFIAVSASMLLVSFLLKHKLLNRAIDQQQVGLVQQAYIVALALAEVPALLGMLDLFVTGNRYYYVLMIIAAGIQLLHFPRREHVESAAFRRTI